MPNARSNWSSARIAFSNRVPITVRFYFTVRVHSVAVVTLNAVVAYLVLEQSAELMSCLVFVPVLRFTRQFLKTDEWSNYWINRCTGTNESQLFWSGDIQHTSPKCLGTMAHPALDPSPSLAVDARSASSWRVSWFWLLRLLNSLLVW